MRRPAQKCIAVLLLLALCLTLAGCWSDDPAAQGDELIDRIGGDTEDADTVVPITSFSLPVQAGETLDPITCSDGVQQTLLPLLYEGLFELDESFTPQNVLCSDYTHSEDYTVWTFTLRSGVTFSDGTALTAEDAAASLQRARSSARYGARLSAVTSVRAENGAVVVTLSRGNNRLPALLDIPIVSRATAGDTVPAGTGPYRYDAGDGAPRLVKNETWWKGEAVPVDEIPLQQVDEDHTLSYLFSSHEIQMLVTDYTGASPVSYKGSISVTDAATTTMQFLGFRCTDGPFADAALRRAVSEGIHRESICKAYFSGHADPAQFPVSPLSPWYPAAAERAYSADSFAQAMEEAGYRTGTRTVHVEMLVCDGDSSRLSAAKAIAAALSIYDLKVTVKTLPYAEYTAALQSGSFDLYYGEVRMTPDFDCTALVGTGGSLNYGGFSDPALDAQITTAFTTVSAPSSANETMLSTLQSAAPIAVICFKSQSVVVQGGAVDEITPTCFNPFYQLSNWEIHIKGEATNG